eukprot:TRINITY_DN7384_c0_g7_i2.p3 TRINITY_DN7384_c0_g7~~TRINITY_DN7384_c0_g7_i2.p3  ORF type:complete len:166 (-),score=65.51 TRINITY_DN7384_c0_g7_i2:135-632(-)
MASSVMQPSMYIQTRPGLTEDEVEEVKQVFDSLDIEGVGFIDPLKLRSSMQSLGFKARDQAVFQMVAEIEKRFNKPIVFEDLLDLLTADMGSRATRDELYRIFSLFDEDETGFITIKELRKAARELGEEVSEEELQEIVRRVDSNNDQKISVDDFYNIMSKKTFP